MNNPFSHIQWVFFDLGETLVDETIAMQDRFERLSRIIPEFGISCTIDDIHWAFESASAEYAPVVFIDALHRLGLDAVQAEAVRMRVPWASHLEQLVPGAVHTLSELQTRYKLAVIANQSPGAEERMRQRGIREFFSFVLSSAEVGLSKPDIAFFQLALDTAGCCPEQAVMVGDRIDNDIRPAKRLGMKTIRFARGFQQSQQPRDEWDVADKTVHSLMEVADVLMNQC
ncbi:MAG: HAD family hydrolase [Armatimonadota bacterium]